MRIFGPGARIADWLGRHTRRAFFVVWIVLALRGALDPVVQLMLRGFHQLIAGSPASFPRSGRENFPA